MSEAIYVPYDDFAAWVALEQLEDYARNRVEVILNAWHKRQFGVGVEHWYKIRSDRVLVALLRGSVAPAAYARRTAEYGEEDLDGLVAGVDYPAEKAGMADISPCGPASLIGKIALELAKRLELETDGDRRLTAPGEVPP